MNLGKINILKKTKKNVTIVYPSKRTLNLATVGEKPVNKTMFAAAMLVMVLVAGMLGKVAVIDKVVALGHEELRVAELKTQIAEGKEKLSQFEDMEDEYAHYTYQGLTEEELGTVSRVEIMKIIDEEVLPIADIGAWTLSGNELLLPISSDNLEIVNKIVERLEKNEKVDYCTVTTAMWDKYNSTTLSTDVTTQWNNDVMSQITVYFINQVEEAE